MSYLAYTVLGLLLHAALIYLLARYLDAKFAAIARDVVEDSDLKKCVCYDWGPVATSAKIFIRLPGEVNPTLQVRLST